MSKLTFAVPSKGRLKDNCANTFSEAGLTLRSAQGDRGYAGEIPEAPGIDLQFRSASEIAGLVVDGGVHLGVTGADLLYETASTEEEPAFLLKPLGFGHANLVVAVPAAWLDVETMVDLDDVAALHEARTGRRLRVATKYPRQTRAHFDACGVGHYRIVESGGATEGLPATGGAEVIVDITTTGATLAGNGLRILSDGIIRKSQAWLCASLSADWSDEALNELTQLMRRLNAREAARDHTVIEFSPNTNDSDLANLPAKVTAPGLAISARADAASVALRLDELGHGPVRLSNPDFIFDTDDEMMRKFRAALGR